MDSSVPLGARASMRPVQAGRLVALAAVAWFSCAPKVHQFHVDPHDICPGTPVIVSWNVEGGHASVRGAPPLDPQSGHTYVPLASMKFILTVKPVIGKAILKEAAVKVFSGNASSPEPDRIGFEPRCSGATIVQEIERPISEWDQKLVVGALESTGSREITVEHEGRHATLTPQAPSTETFDGTRLAGRWRISSPLLLSEGCDGTGQKPPRVVILTAHVRCGN